VDEANARYSSPLLCGSKRKFDEAFPHNWERTLSALLWDGGVGVGSMVSMERTKRLRLGK
jgi:hypothetical protein